MNDTNRATPPDIFAVFQQDPNCTNTINVSTFDFDSTLRKSLNYTLLKQRTLTTLH